MKVRILTNVSDLSGVHLAGDEPDLIEERAIEYVKSGLAEEIIEAPAPESAMLGDPPDRATLPRARHRGY